MYSRPVKESSSSKIETGREALRAGRLQSNGCGLFTEIAAGNVRVMSKAFTREDDLPDLTVTRPLPSPLPPGAKNYLTPDGARRLRAELDNLVAVERPKIAASGADRARGKLQALDQRIQYLDQSLQAAVIVNPPVGPEDRIRFGATVTVRERSGEESRYRIVGVDETDVDRGWVSWLSPTAKALLNARLGERVRVRLPGGEKELEITGIRYE